MYNNIDIVKNIKKFLINKQKILIKGEKKMKIIAKNKAILIRNLLLLGIVIVSTALIITIVNAALKAHSETIVHNPHHLWYPTGFWANIWNSLSTFTIQSNILVLVFFILSIINFFKKNRFSTINQGWFKFTVTIYITITFIIFWVSLFKILIATTDFSNSIDLMNFVNTFLLHLFTPIIMIAFYFITSGTKRWAIKPTLTKTLPISISYLFIYLTYILIKGSFVGQIVNKNEIDYSYPYFFLNVKESLRTFFMYLGIILILFLALFFIYYYYNNWKYQRNHKKLKNKNQNITKVVIK